MCVFAYTLLYKGSFYTTIDIDNSILEDFAPSSRTDIDLSSKTDNYTPLPTINDLSLPLEATYLLIKELRYAINK